MSLIRSWAVGWSVVLFALVLALAGAVLPSSAAPAGGLAGRVTGPDGTPLRGIEVVAWSESGLSTTLLTDADGRYSFSGLAPHRYVLTFYDPDGEWVTEHYDDVFGWEQSTRVVVVDGTVSGPYDASLGAPGSISGTVRGEGEAAVGSSVDLYRREGASWRYTRNTSVRHDGTYVFDDLHPGAYRVGVDRPDEPWVDTFHPAADLVDNGADIVVGHEQDVTGADVALLREGTIQGVVTDTAGDPVPGVTVTATDTDTERRYFEAVTDADGRYRIGRLTTDDYTVYFNGYRAGKQGEFWSDAPTLHTATPVHVVSGEDSDGVDAVVTEPSMLRGTLTDAETGDPVPYAKVVLYEKRGDLWQGMRMEAHADGRGRYAFEGVWGTYRMLAIDSGFSTHDPAYYTSAPSHEQPAIVEVPAGGDVVADIGLPAKPGTSIVSGTVTALGEGRGEVFVGAELLIEGQWIDAAGIETAADGTYRLHVPSAGTYRVGFSDRRGQLADQWWEGATTAAAATPLQVDAGGAGVNGINAELAGPVATGDIRGTVTAPPGGLAQVDARVTVYAWDAIADQWSEIRRTRTGPAGAYAVEGLPVGSYRVGFAGFGRMFVEEFYPDSATVAAAHDVEVAAGIASVVDAELALSDGAIAGTVTATDGAPVDDVHVTAYAWREGTWQQVGESGVEANGGFVVDGLPAGIYRVGFRDDASRLATEYWQDQTTVELAQDVHVQSGETTWLHGPELASRPPPPAYTDSSKPGIGGIPRVGEVLTAAYGTWTPTDASYAYQWLNDGGEIPGANGQTLVLTNDHVGSRIRVRVTAFGASATTGSSTSDTTAQVLAAPVETPDPTPNPTPDPTPDPTPTTPGTVNPAPAPVPTISNPARPRIVGRLEVGEVLRLRKGTWSPSTVTLTYQWLADGTRIRKATRATLAVTRKQLDKRITVRVTAALPGTKSLVTTTRPTARVRA